MLETRRSGKLQSGVEFFDELPAVESIAEVNEARRTVHYGDGELRERSENLRRLLVRIHSVTQCQLRNAGRVLLAEVVGDGQVVLGCVRKGFQR